jgi:hypothetical protein
MSISLAWALAYTSITSNQPLIGQDMAEVLAW